jgi:hypothetical protein
MRRIALAVLAALSITACAKKGGEAIVVSKEHIDAREENSSPAASSEDPAKEEVSYREMAPDEIDVEGFVMKKEVRGTGKDPRAATEEQWRVTVEMVDVSRTFVVRTDRARYEKLKKGDRVRVRYSEGKYTGTIWGAELAD